jgi:HrpA-like RNA helicase
VTIPDCDHVVCCGLSKRLKWSSQTQSSQLAKGWISKAAATQRAGRTGRTRPGNVYRLYSKHVFESTMEAFDTCAMKEQPLSGICLHLITELPAENLVHILNEVLEPPDISHIGSALRILHDMALVDGCEPDDCGATERGHFVSRMGLDLNLGYMLALGMMLDVLPEAVALATAMSATTPPWRIAHPMIHTGALPVFLHVYLYIYIYILLCCFPLYIYVCVCGTTYIPLYIYIYR